MTRQRNPDFIIVGSMKAGTTAASAMLAQHKDIGVARSSNGEVHYFDNHRSRGVAWYRGLFADLGPKAVVGEKSPRYMAVPEAMVDMQLVVPRVKLIVLLRDPVERFISHLAMMKRNRPRVGRTPKLDARWRGCYAPQLQFMFGLFPRDQVKVVFTESLWTDTSAVMNDLYGWLGVESNVKVNVRRSSTPKPKWAKTREALTEYYRPFNEQLVRLLPDREDEIRLWKGMT